MDKIVIVGVGGFGREVAWLIERINSVKPTWELVGFVDDNKALMGDNISGYPVVGDSEWLNNQCPRGTLPGDVGLKEGSCTPGRRRRQESEHGLSRQSGPQDIRRARTGD